MAELKRNSRSIEIEFINLITKDACFRITLPLSTVNPINISRLYKGLKPKVAEGECIPASRISAKHRVIESDNKTNGRILFEWRGGISLDMPDNATAYDYSIVLAQLDVIKMKFKTS